MTAPDLAAICERHGIVTRECPTYVSSAHWEAWFGDTVNSTVNGPTEAGAICALLKARHEIVTERYFSASRERLWSALSPVLNDWGTSGHRTELAAVVALADRLARVTA